MYIFQDLTQKTMRVRHSLASFVLFLWTQMSFFSEKIFFLQGLKHQNQGGFIRDTAICRPIQDLDFFFLKFLFCSELFSRDPLLLEGGKFFFEDSKIKHC